MGYWNTGSISVSMLGALVIGGCSTGAAYDDSALSSFSAPSSMQSASTFANYRIGPLDKLSVTVFQVKDLTIEEVQVDASGQLSLPLIGSLPAAGKTVQELSTDIADRLRQKYLQSPQVAVSVKEATSQKVTIDGSVREPGVYPMLGPTTLLQAVAMAKGPDLKLANLNRVAIFRTIDGQRAVAVYDLEAIRKGKAVDPEIQGNDVIVVDGSRLKGTLREILAALPAVAAFRYF